MHTEWRLIEVDEQGDIEHVDSGRIYQMEEAIIQIEPRAGCLLTIEGVKDLKDGARLFRRTGHVKGPLDHPAFTTWAVQDHAWYESGEEPDFGERL